jgi:hypothetical protein
MNDRLKELITNLEKAIVETRGDTKKQLALKELLHKMKKSADLDNWVAEEVIKLVSHTPGMMDNKYRAFKHFCQSLNPSKIELGDAEYELFYGEKPVNKPKSKR